MNENIIKSIKDAYVSLDNPNWSFTSVRLAQGLHGKFIKQLSDISSVSGNTDLNNDCSRCLNVELDGETIGIRVSLVGNFACAHNDKGFFYSEIELQNFRLGRFILEMLKLYHIELLKEESLREEIEFGGELQNVYSILFSSDELL